MEVFYKNKRVKWKKQVLDVQNGKSFAHIDVDALILLNNKVMLKDLCER